MCYNIIVIIMKKDNKKNLIVILLAGAIFILTAILVMSNKLDSLDKFVYNILPKNDVITCIMKIITSFGEFYTFGIISILFLMIAKDKINSLCIPLNLGIISGLNYILKVIIRRPRPIGYRLIEETGFSFPSGHSATSLAFYGYIIYLIYKYCKSRKLKVISITLLSTLILMIGISRIYLGVHYASDVIGAFLYSTSYLLIYVIVTEKIKKNFKL